jgi:hypothetical protein
LLSPPVHSAFDHAPGPAPAVEGGPGEVTKAPGGFAGGLRLGAGGRHLGFDRRGKAGVARQPEQVVDAVLLTPSHQGLAGKAAIAP